MSKYYCSLKFIFRCIENKFTVISKYLIIFFKCDEFFDIFITIYRDVNIGSKSPQDFP